MSKVTGDVIQQLKDNEKPFGLMTEEMQAKAEELGASLFHLVIISV